MGLQASASDRLESTSPERGGVTGAVTVLQGQLSIENKELM